MCPFAQKAAIALNYAFPDYTSQTVNLYSSSCPFPKSKLREVESNYGLTPKGYIPVLLHEVEGSDPVCLQESDDILDYIVSLDESLKPSNLANHNTVRRAVKALPTNTNKPDSLLTTLDGVCSTSAFLGGDSFSTTDCIALPFLQVRDLTYLKIKNKYINQTPNTCTRLIAEDQGDAFAGRV